jgi:hypothetical protein
MRKISLLVMIVSTALAAFIAGRWSTFNTTVKAVSEGTPQIELRPIAGDTSLTVYYPGLNKLFVYQSPFVGLPTWNCSYSIQLSSPGGKIERQQCPSPEQRF